VLIQGGTFPIYAAGRLLFTRQGALHAVAFDPQRLEVRGEPQQILNGFMTTGGAVGAASGNGSSQVSVAANGTVAYLPPVAQTEPDVRPRHRRSIRQDHLRIPGGEALSRSAVLTDGKRLAIRVSNDQAEPDPPAGSGEKHADATDLRRRLHCVAGLVAGWPAAGVRVEPERKGH
jgi:hypothetical protein